MGFYIAVFSKQGPYVLARRVTTSVASILLAEPLKSKSAADISSALATMIFQTEYVWGVSNVRIAIWRRVLLACVRSWRQSEFA